MPQGILGEIQFKERKEKRDREMGGERRKDRRREGGRGAVGKEGGETYTEEVRVINCAADRLCLLSHTCRRRYRE